MKILPHYKPERIASRDEERANLWHPYLDVQHEAVVATNGFALVAVPVETDGFDTNGHIHRELLQVARKKVKEEPAEIREHEELVPHGITYPLEPGIGDFPAWRQVIPAWSEGGPGTVTIGLNPRLLKEIANALGAGGAVALTVKLDEVETAPILVRALAGDEREIGILMPCRIDSKSGKVAKPTPVVDLPPTEAEKKKAQQEELERLGDKVIAEGRVSPAVARAVQAFKDSVPEGTAVSVRVGNGPERVIADKRPKGGE